MAKKKMDMAYPATAAESHKDGSPDDYEAKNALDDIMRAEEHKQKPDLMKRVHAHAGRKQKALQGIRSVKDLRATYDRKFGSGRKDKSKVMDDDEDGV